MIGLFIHASVVIDQVLKGVNIRYDTQNTSPSDVMDVEYVMQNIDKIRTILHAVGLIETMCFRFSNENNHYWYSNDGYIHYTNLITLRHNKYYGDAVTRRLDR